MRNNVDLSFLNLDDDDQDVKELEEYFAKWSSPTKHQNRRKLLRFNLASILSFGRRLSGNDAVDQMVSADHVEGTIQTRNNTFDNTPLQFTKSSGEFHKDISHEIDEELPIYTRVPHLQFIKFQGDRIQKWDKQENAVKLETQGDGSGEYKLWYQPMFAIERLLQKYKFFQNFFKIQTSVGIGGAHLNKKIGVRKAFSFTSLNYREDKKTVRYNQSPFQRCNNVASTSQAFVQQNYRLFNKNSAKIIVNNPPNMIANVYSGFANHQSSAILEPLDLETKTIVENGGFTYPDSAIVNKWDNVKRVCMDNWLAPRNINCNNNLPKLKNRISDENGISAPAEFNSRIGESQANSFPGILPYVKIVLCPFISCFENPNKNKNSQNFT